ncbi:hypothetical protein Taro_044385 [Colocasia esculenta]|uniref:DUF4216 domain-containing protein n=1 Tax=Colocasia esculenta TaxID=4460 RepID=A0A843WY69_COLES|nr:hypothetical protein [Colocasia esculenta]
MQTITDPRAAIRTRRVEKEREKSFATWLRYQVEQGFITDSRVQEISYGPSKIVRVYPGYIVDGYRFHTRDYGQNKSTMNNNVCVKGSAYNENEVDYYGILEEVIELQFLGQGNNGFLVKCHWFDPTSIHNDIAYGIINVRLPDYAGCPGDRVYLPDYAACPGDRVCLPDYTGCPGDRVRLPDYAGCPSDRLNTY